MDNDIKLIISCNEVYRKDYKLYRFFGMSNEEAMKMAKDESLPGVYFYCLESPITDEDLFKHIVGLASSWIYQKLDDYGKQKADYVIFSKTVEVDGKKVEAIGIRYRIYTAKQDRE